MGLHIHPGLNAVGTSTLDAKWQRVNRGRSIKMIGILSCPLARALNPLQGGSAPRNAERPVKLQLLQPFAVDRFKEGN